MTMRASLKDVIVQSENQYSANFGDKIVIMAPFTRKYFVLDAVGSWIWRKIETPASIGDLCDQLCREEPVTPEVCARDVLAFVDDLISRNLIEIER